MIHPSAVIHPDAKVDPSVEVGPFAVIDGGVELGPENRVGPHTHLTGATRIGRGNVFHSGAVIGDAPQDLKYSGVPTQLTIGDENVFREHVTVHRSTTTEGETAIGSNNFFMANSHVGHNCHLGDRVIIANGALLGGHVIVEDNVFISGNCLAHQFVRIGTLALMQGGSAISKDLPPYTVARGDNGICGLNIIGLRRAQLTSQQRIELKRLYQLLFRGKRKLKDALTEASRDYTSSTARVMLEFIAASTRGVCADHG
jgi:UDP-N-acetylglucosamine acyltransferase